jgi:hypothetical protein
MSGSPKPSAIYPCGRLARRDFIHQIGGGFLGLALGGVWAEYRDQDIADFHLGLRVEQLPVFDAPQSPAPAAPAPSAVEIDLPPAVDAEPADAVAVDCMRRNLAPFGTRASCHWHDVAAGIDRAAYDAVLVNPPFHNARGEDRALGVRFIAAVCSTPVPMLADATQKRTTL